MPRTPIVFTTTHRVQFSDLDPYNHVGTGRFATIFVDHRMQGLSRRIGWDAATTVPSEDCLSKLGLQFLAADMRKLKTV